MNYKVLVVDDEVMIVNLIKKQLKIEGYLVYTALNANQALEQLSLEPDIILLDINMPGMDGLELCARIREYITCPIIFLTAKVTEQDKVNGLAAGGDDYITKPFSMDELFARIKAHIRREERTRNNVKAIFTEELIIDYGRRTVMCNGEVIELSNKEFEIIKLLSMNQGLVFDREKIYEKIWGYDKSGDSIVIKEHIRKIRLRFAEHTDNQYIETVWGVGYRWKK